MQIQTIYRKEDKRIRSTSVDCNPHCFHMVGEDALNHSPPKPELSNIKS